MSIVGLAGVSKKNTLVFGRIASTHAWLSRASMVVDSMPKRGNSWSTSHRHEPNAARPATTWSPWLSWHSRATVMAAIPLDWTRHASAPSIAAIRSSSIATVGFCSRE
jgi:hypothetical protein